MYCRSVQTFWSEGHIDRKQQPFGAPYQGNISWRGGRGKLDGWAANSATSPASGWGFGSMSGSFPVHCLISSNDVYQSLFHFVFSFSAAFVPVLCHFPLSSSLLCLTCSAFLLLWSSPSQSCLYAFIGSTVCGAFNFLHWTHFYYFLGGSDEKLWQAFRHQFGHPWSVG